MEWEIHYRHANGAKQTITIECDQLPHLKKAAVHVVHHAFGGRPPKPLGNYSVATWLEICDIEIIDISTNIGLPYTQSVTFSRPIPYYRKDRSEN